MALLYLIYANLTMQIIKLLVLRTAHGKQKCAGILLKASIIILFVRQHSFNENIHFLQTNAT